MEELGHKRVNDEVRENALRRIRERRCGAGEAREYEEERCGAGEAREYEEERRIIDQIIPNARGAGLNAIWARGAIWAVARAFDAWREAENKLVDDALRYAGTGLDEEETAEDYFARKWEDGRYGEREMSVEDEGIKIDLEDYEGGGFNSTAFGEIGEWIERLSEGRGGGVDLAAPERPRTAERRQGDFERWCVAQGKREREAAAMSRGCTEEEAHELA